MLNKIESKSAPSSRNANRALGALLCLLVLLGLTAPSSGLAANAPTPTPCISFYDVPGITPEEIASIKALQAKGGFMRYAMLHTSEAFIRPDGSVGGFSALFAAWMSQLFELEFRVEIMDWDSLLQGISDHSVDFTGEFTASPERQQKYIMSNAFSSRTIRTYRLRGHERLEQIAERRRPCIAFLKGTTTIDKALDNLEFEADIIFLDREEQATEALRNGRADAYIAEDAIFRNGEIVGEDLFPVVYTPVSLSTANPELAPVISVFNKYLKTGDPQRLIELHDRGKAEFLQYSLHYLLSTEEKKYLAARQVGGKPVRLAAEPDTYPASFYNQHDDAWQGIAHDVLQQVSVLTGLRFKIVNSPEASWAELLNCLESGQADMITELIESPDREGRFLWAADPYARDYYALVSRQDHEDVTVQHILYSKVGFTKDSAYASVFYRWYPDHPNVRQYATASDVFAALEAGEVDFMMASRNLLLTVTNYKENPKFKANLIFAKTYKSGFGFHKDQQILCSIISKAQSLVDMRGIEDRWVRKVFDYQGKKARESLPYLYVAAGVLACFTLLLLLALAKNYHNGKGLKQSVNARLNDLDKQTSLSRRSYTAANKFLERVEAEIHGSLENIRQQAEDGAANTPCNPKPAETILATTRRILGVLKNLREMAKIESGEFKLEKQPFSLLEMMRQIASQTDKRCQEKNINFDSNVESLENSNLIGDADRLRQVLLNLLENAVYHSPPRGLVSFYVSYIEIPDENPVNSARLRFEVRDSGAGLTKEQAARIFTPLSQGDGTTLALGHYLIREMGGELMVKSTPGHGSCFAFSICLDRARQA